MHSRNLITKVKTAKNKTTSSALWLKRQLNDQYVIQAKKEGFRSRAAYKLIEIDNKFHLLSKTKFVLDLGAAPGSWSQVLAQKKSAKVIGIDILPIEPMSGAHFIQGDFSDESTLQEIRKLTNGAKIDLLLSDMAPNVSGHKSVDHLRIVVLFELVFEFAKKHLAKDGAMVVKIFQGGTENALLQQIKQHFSKVKHFKPLSSRKESSEIYLIATGFKDVKQPVCL